MKISAMSRKRKVWLAVVAAVAVLTVVAAIICLMLLPDVFKDQYAKQSEADKAMMNVITPLVIVLLLCIAVILTLLFKNSSSGASYFTTKKMTYLAVFTAISYIFYMFIKFNLPIFPSFLDFQISDMPALLCGFMMGPVGGIIVIVLKVALKLPFSSSGFVGEFGDLILGIAFVLPASLIYKYKRTKKGAIIGLACGSLACVVASLLVNRFMLIPFYLSQGYFGGSLSGIASKLSALYKNITEDNFYAYFLGLGVLPFNILRCLLSALVTFFVYKRCEKLFLKMFGEVRAAKTAKKEIAISDETID